jgi:hypothetical protein
VGNVAHTLLIACRENAADCAFALAGSPRGQMAVVTCGWSSLAESVSKLKSIPTIKGLAHANADFFGAPLIAPCASEVAVAPLKQRLSLKARVNRESSWGPLGGKMSWT